jgi:hypothetical protein
MEGAVLLPACSTETAYVRSFCGLGVRVFGRKVQAGLAALSTGKEPRDLFQVFPKSVIHPQPMFRN